MIGLVCLCQKVSSAWGMWQGFAWDYQDVQRGTKCISQTGSHSLEVGSKKGNEGEMGELSTAWEGRKGLKSNSKGEITKGWP